MITAEKCLQELRNIKSVTFSTCDENGKPQARIIDVMRVENDRLYFCTARGKAFYSQLIEKPYVAIVGMNENYEVFNLSGAVKRCDDDEQEHQMKLIFELNPILEQVYKEKSRHILEAFYVVDATLEYFSLGAVIKRKTFTIGNAENKKEILHISNNCIGCGECVDNCPRDCIKTGSPYEIIEENCLHCGLCKEVCPVKAIEVSR